MSSAIAVRAGPARAGLAMILAVLLWGSSGSGCAASSPEFPTASTPNGLVQQGEFIDDEALSILVGGRQPTVGEPTPGSPAPPTERAGRFPAASDPMILPPAPTVALHPDPETDQLHRFLEGVLPGTEEETVPWVDAEEQPAGASDSADVEFDPLNLEGVLSDGIDEGNVQ